MTELLLLHIHRLMETKFYVYVLQLQFLIALYKVNKDLIKDMHFTLFFCQHAKVHSPLTIYLFVDMELHEDNSFRKDRIFVHKDGGCTRATSFNNCIYTPSACRQKLGYKK